LGLRRDHRRFASAPSLPGGCSRQEIGQISRKGAVTTSRSGCDAGKQVKGRKIHALVDSEWLPMRVVVHSAAMTDCEMADGKS
jgi:hypothetical protein